MCIVTYFIIIIFTPKIHSKYSVNVYENNVIRHYNADQSYFKVFVIRVLRYAYFRTY